MVISVCERGGRVHSTAADSTAVSRSRDGAEVRVVLGSGAEVRGTLALTRGEATALRAALDRALAGGPPGERE
jgi:hypothetical protein